MSSQECLSVVSETIMRDTGVEVLDRLNVNADSITLSSPKVDCSAYAVTEALPQNSERLLGEPAMQLRGSNKLEGFHL